MNRLLAPALALVTSMLTVACASLPAAQPNALTVTDIRAKATELDGKEVLVRGYITVEFENNSIWASPADTDDLRQNNCLGLDIPDNFYDKRLDKQWVVLRGIVHVFPKDTISLNACSGVGLQLLQAPTRIVKPAP